MATRNLVKPVYKRQQFLISFIRELDEPLTTTDIQKLLFLYLMSNSLPYYDFVPYLYGSFSIQASEDIGILHRMGWLSHYGKRIRYAGSEGVRYLDTYLEGCIDRISDQLPKARGNELIKLVYEQYPYYAINSRLASIIMDADGIVKIKVEKARLKQSRSVLFTVGYEGISIEEYLNRLIKNDVHVLCDVRSNPLSRKLGFSKSSLQKYISNIGIEYVHLPELGIKSEKRNNLSSDDDYCNLFADYKSTLSQYRKSLDDIHRLLQSRGRIALTCFERDPLHCHRHIIRDYLKETYSVETADI